MKKTALFLTFLVVFTSYSFPQSFLLTGPRLEFDGNMLTISYDLVTKDQSDMFYVWVEMRNQAGIPYKTATFRGEVGDSISPGNNKKITWTPSEDGIFLDEDMTVELKGELYIRSFNKGTMLLLSTVVPGLGQSKITKGKPWWLASIPAYGALAGGFLMHKNYVNTYNSYQTTKDPVERNNLLDRAQSQGNLADIMFISSAVIWAGNIIWVAATPNKYRPLQHTKFSVNTVPYGDSRVAMFSLNVNF